MRRAARKAGKRNAHFGVGWDFSTRWLGRVTLKDLKKAQVMWGNTILEERMTVLKAPGCGVGPGCSRNSQKVVGKSHSRSNPREAGVRS